MPSPIAHVGVALGLLGPWPVRWGLWARIVFATLAPDLDVLPMLWDENGIRWHRGPTHSVVGAVIIGLLAGLGSGYSWRERMVLVVACLLHLPLDWSTGEPGAPLKYGVPLLWPFSDRRWLDPNPYFGAFQIDQPGGLKYMLVGSALGIYGKELLTGVIFWAGRWGLGKLKRR